MSSLHVLVSALCGKPDDQVPVERWTSSEREWIVWIGGVVVQAPDGKDQVVPDSLLQTIESLIGESRLEPRIHWARFFYANVGNENTECEFLLDGDPLESAQIALRGLDWSREDFYYSVRNFLMMLPA